MSAKLLRVVGIVVVGATLACVTAISRAQLAFATGDDADVSSDGLHLVERGQIVGAWAKPDLDLSGYTRIYYQPTVVAFRDVNGATPDLFTTTRTDDIYSVSDTRQAQLREQFAEAVYEAIGGIDRFDLTTDIGRDVLLVRVSLLDFISAVPPDLAGSRTGSIRWAYEATLSVEMRDAMSDEVLARTIERQRADGPIDINDVTVLTPRLLNNWAGRLARSVERFGELAR